MMMGSLGKIGLTVMMEFLGEMEPTVMTRSFASKTVKPIIIITMTAASSTIPTIMHIAFVGLHFDDGGLTDFDFVEAVVISSIVERKGFPCFDVVISFAADMKKSAFPLSVQLLILEMDPRLLTLRRVEQRDPVDRAKRQRRPNIHTNSKHFREFPIGCDLLFSQKNGYPRESSDSILGYEDLEASKKWVFDDPFSLSVGHHGYDEYCSPMTMNSGGGDGCLYTNR